MMFALTHREVFARLFQKAAGSKGRALVAIRRWRNSIFAFLFAKLFLCATGAKEKASDGTRKIFIKKAKRAGQ